MGIWPSYVDVPKNASVKFEAQIEMSLYAVELQFHFTGERGLNFLQHDNAPVHKASSTKLYFWC